MTPSLLPGWREGTGETIGSIVAYEDTRKVVSVATWLDDGLLVEVVGKVEVGVVREGVLVPAEVVVCLGMVEMGVAVEVGVVREEVLVAAEVVVGPGMVEVGVAVEVGVVVEC